MDSDDKLLARMLGRALSGEGAHVSVNNAVEGLDWKLAGAQREGVAHSVFAVVNHMIFWNEWVLQWLAGANPAIPKHAPGGWPGKAAPQNAAEWRQCVRRFVQQTKQLTRAAREAELVTKGGRKTPLDMLQAIASHNSYHVGQVVLLRQALGAWPPPAGGLTW